MATYTFTKSFRLSAAATSSQASDLAKFRSTTTSTKKLISVSENNGEMVEVGQYACVLTPSEFTSEGNSTTIKSIKLKYKINKESLLGGNSNCNSNIYFWLGTSSSSISYSGNRFSPSTGFYYWNSSTDSFHYYADSARVDSTEFRSQIWKKNQVELNKNFQDGSIELFNSGQSVQAWNSSGVIIGMGVSDNTTLTGYIYIYDVWVEVTYEAEGYRVEISAYPDKNAGTVGWVDYSGGNSNWGITSTGSWRYLERYATLDLTATANSSAYYQFDCWDMNGTVVSYSPQFNTGKISSNRTYYANFIKPRISISVGVADEKGGGWLSGWGQYSLGDTVTLQIEADTGYKCGSIIQLDSNGNTIATIVSNNGSSDQILTGTFTITEDQDLYFQATFIPQLYTISYNANGGITTPNSQEGLIDSTSIQIAPKISRNSITENGYTITVKSNGGTQSDQFLIAENIRSYTFKEWNTKADGTGNKYTPGQSYSGPNSLILYAIWTSAISTYGNIKLPSNSSYQRTGYTLLGFSTNQNATSATYSPGASIQPSANTTYYAIWKKTISITYDINGGAGELPTPPASKDIYNTTTSTDFSLTTTNLSISKEGHTFGGWSKTKGGTTAVGSSITVSDSTTLYAIWKVNQYTITPKFYVIDLNGNITENNSGGYLQLEDGTILSSSQAFNYGETIHVTAKVNSGYAFSKWGDISSALNSRDITIPAQNIEISAYFIIKNKVLVINRNSSSPNSDVSIWLREKIDSSTYGNWFQMPYDNEYSFSKNTTVQIVFEHGENYEFDHIVASQVGLPPVGLDPYSDYQITGQTTFTVYSNKRESYNNIYLGSSNKPYTSGYVKNPNFSFEEEISSIWVGGKQIMGKAPKELYPYIIDTLLGDTLYIGLYDSIDNWKNGANMKTEIPDYAYNHSPNQIKHLKMSNNIIKIGHSAFRGAGLETIQLSSNLLELGSTAFYQGNSGVSQYFNNYKKIYLPASIVLLNKASGFDFESKSIEKIVVDKNNLYYASDNQGVLYNKNKTLLVQYPQRRKNNTYYLPFIEGIFGNNCFVNQNYLKDIYYKGTKQQWDSLITLEGSHSRLFTIHCSDGITFTAQL